jgi:glutaminyl-peptide cyclotransferase
MRLSQSSWLRRLSAHAVSLVVLTVPLGTARPEVVPLAPQALQVHLLAVYPHDPKAFTEGLEIKDGRVFESLGLYGRSEVREVDIATGTVVRKAKLPRRSFGEGLTFVGDTVWQLTYREQVAYVWDRASLSLRGRQRYDGEGWGLCYHRGTGRLVMSNGTGRLSLRDPAKFVETGYVQIEGLDSQERPSLNELECAGDTVWAFLHPTPRIAKIDIRTGLVTAVVDASALTSHENSKVYEMNGIAAVPGTDMFLVTGKHWSHTFLVRFVAA